jgi:DNA repair exonuclease SbcCD ATPase subunit
MHKQLGLERTIFLSLFFFFFVLLFVDVSYAVSPIEQLFETIRFDPVQVYGANPWFIDLILFLIFFIGLTNFILAERIGKPASVAFGLMLAVGLNYWMGSIGKNLASFGSIFALAFVGIMIILLYHLLNATPLHGHPWVINSLTYLAAFLALMTLGSMVWDWLGQAGGIGSALQALLTVLALVALGICAWGLFRSVGLMRQITTGIPQLQTDVQNLGGQLQGIDRQNANLQHSVDSLSNQMVDTEVRQNEALAQLERRFAQDVALIRQDLGNLQTNVTNIAQATGQISTLSQTLTTIQNTLGTLEAQIIQLQGEMLTPASLQALSERFTQIDTYLSQTRTFLDSQLSALDTQIKTIIREQAELAKKPELVDAVKNALKTDLTSLQAEVSKLEQFKAELNRDLDSAKQELEAAIKDAKATKPQPKVNTTRRTQNTRVKLSQTQQILQNTQELLGRVAKLEEQIRAIDVTEGQVESREIQIVSQLENLHKQLTQFIPQLQKELSSSKDVKLKENYADFVKNSKKLANWKLDNLDVKKLELRASDLRNIAQSIENKPPLDKLRNLLFEIASFYDTWAKLKNPSVPK